MRFKKWIIIFGAAVVICGIAAYEIVLPVNAAKSYTGKLDRASKPVHACLISVSNTTQANVFNNPDQSGPANLKQIQSIDQTIADCQAKLASFNKTARRLQHWPLSGYTDSYHNAEVRQAQAESIVGQSNDVLTQYRQVTSFLKTYFSYDMAFVNYTSAVNAVSDLSTLTSQTVQLSEQGATLIQNAKGLRDANAPPGYQALVNAAAAMYEQAGEGFATLASGLREGSDMLTSTGIGAIEAATNTHDSSVDDMPSSLSQSSYALDQASDLPDKIADLFSQT